MLKEILIDLDLTKCCLQPFHSNVEGHWELVSPPSAPLRYALIRQFLDSLFCSKNVEDCRSVLSLVSQGKHVCLLTTLKIKALHSLSFVKAGGCSDGRDPGAVEAQQRSWAAEDLPQKGGSREIQIVQGSPGGTDRAAGHVEPAIPGGTALFLTQPCPLHSSQRWASLLLLLLCAEEQFEQFSCPCKASLSWGLSDPSDCRQWFCTCTVLTWHRLALPVLWESKVTFATWLPQCAQLVQAEEGCQRWDVL